MTELEIVKWIVYGIMGVGMWFMKRNIDRTDEALKELRYSQDDIRKTYTHKDDFKDFKVEIRGIFEEIKRDIKDIKNEKDHLAR